MIKEKLEIYSLKGKFLGVMDRKVFHEQSKREFFKFGKVFSKVKTVRLVLMNSNGMIYIQKRSLLKKDNAGLYDKTIGGHVPAGYTWDISLVKECAEELGFPIAVVPKEEFIKSVKSVDLKVIGVAREIDLFKNFNSLRIVAKKFFIQPSIAKIYLGYYDGSIQFKDGESSGIEVFSLKELLKEIKEKPEKFTEDIKFIVKNYKRYLIKLKK
ncbi:MAG: NUDIX hydrolase [Parcubacteria group bacterium Gr01-1014_24]|nr:MAG: NUDIX hydrolase [Parcubacteria group bacterium Gr01-1014_24]